MTSGDDDISGIEMLDLDVDSSIKKDEVSETNEMFASHLRNLILKHPDAPGFLVESALHQPNSLPSAIDILFFTIPLEKIERPIEHLLASDNNTNTEVARVMKVNCDSGVVDEIFDSVKDGFVEWGFVEKTAGVEAREVGTIVFALGSGGHELCARIAQDFGLLHLSMQNLADLDEKEEASETDASPNIEEALDLAEINPNAASEPDSCASPPEVPDSTIETAKVQVKDPETRSCVEGGALQEELPNPIESIKLLDPLLIAEILEREDFSLTNALMGTQTQEGKRESRNADIVATTVASAARPHKHSAVQFIYVISSVLAALIAALLFYKL
ncbi:hypothetical protein HDU78_011622 [Chytriomyces hyalinus]|nr:hypothetical protein HDU78_011622 [Chytriomyces hyalinus]